MKISSGFDGGSIDVIAATDPNAIRLKLKPDNCSEFKQWFYFKLTTTPMVTHRLIFEELDSSAYPRGWVDYQVLASYDKEEWFRIDSQFDGTCMHCEFTPEHDLCFFAYFTPYSHERHESLLATAQAQFDCRYECLGETLDGRDLGLLVIGNEAERDTKRKIWITARQHPGETMAEYCAEGLIYRLLDVEDSVARKLLLDCIFYVVPNVNPDGSYRGHLRTNAIGVNLNREWDKASPERSPEVFFVQQRMREIGCDLFLDLHGDEALPYVFVAGCEGNPKYSSRIEQLEQRFKQALSQLTPDFQTEVGYPLNKPGCANLSIATNAVGNEFDCLAFTLEMPFKDNCLLPDPAYGWSSTRSAALGKALVGAIFQIYPMLR